MTLGKRVASIRASMVKSANLVLSIQDSDFLVTPTCPPTTAVRVLRGKAWIDSNRWAFMTYRVEQPDDEVDFSTAANIGYGADAWRPSFANQYHYVGFVLGLTSSYVIYGSEPKYRVYGDLGEYEGAADAEAEVDAFLNGGTFVGSAIWLWAIILRNDGATGSAGAILPVDQMNRGQSYLYRDVRGQMWING